MREIPTLVVTVTQSFAMMRPHHKTIISLFLDVRRQTGTITFFSLRRNVLVDCSRLWQTHCIVVNIVRIMSRDYLWRSLSVCVCVGHKCETCRNG